MDSRKLFVFFFLASTFILVFHPSKSSNTPVSVASWIDYDRSLRNSRNLSTDVSSLFQEHEFNSHGIDTNSVASWIDYDRSLRNSRNLSTDVSSIFQDHEFNSLGIDCRIMGLLFAIFLIFQFSEIRTLSEPQSIEDAPILEIDLDLNPLVDLEYESNCKHTPAVPHDSEKGPATIQILSDELPKIVPYVLINHREEIERLNAAKSAVSNAEEIKLGEMVPPSTGNLESVENQNNDYIHEEISRSDDNEVADVAKDLQKDNVAPLETDNGLNSEPHTPAVPHDSEKEPATIQILSKALPKVVPYVLINHREELLPLMIPDSSTRDSLTHTLFKHPDEQQRRIIMEKSYEISPYQSSDDEFFIDRTTEKSVPSWASKGALDMALPLQLDLDPEKIFAKQSFCGIDEVLQPTRIRPLWEDIFPYQSDDYENNNTLPLWARLDLPIKLEREIEKLFPNGGWIDEVRLPWKPASFVPVFEQKQAVKRCIKVAALEAARDAKRREDEKENERKMKKKAFNIERKRVAKENARQMELNRKKKEEEMIRKEEEVAAKKKERVREIEVMEKKKREKIKKKQAEVAARRSQRDREMEINKRKMEEEIEKKETDVLERKKKQREEEKRKKMDKKRIEKSHGGTRGIK